MAREPAARRHAWVIIVTVVYTTVLFAYGGYVDSPLTNLYTGVAGSIEWATKRADGTCVLTRLIGPLPQADNPLNFPCRITYCHVE